MSDELATAMMKFVDASPTPFHMCAEASALVADASGGPPHRLAKEARFKVCKVKCDLGFLIFDTVHDGPMKQFFTRCETARVVERKLVLST